MKVTCEWCKWHTRHPLDALVQISPRGKVHLMRRLVWRKGMDENFEKGVWTRCKIKVMEG